LLGGDKDAPGMFLNGITLSPDEKYLYVTAGGGRTMRYDILPDDTIANDRLFVQHGSRALHHRLHPSLQNPGESARCTARTTIGIPRTDEVFLAKNLLKSGSNGLSNGVVWVRYP
jgi:hypothetical protein